MRAAAAAPNLGQRTTTVAIALFALAEAARRLTDYDLPWNVASGRAIVEAGGIPRVDALAYTHAPLKYVEALGDAVLYAIDRAFGPVGLQLTGPIACAALAFALARATRGGAESGRAITFLALAAIATWLIVRPQLFAFAFLAITLAAIESHRDDPASRRGRMALWALVPLQAVWANVHGMAPLGALVLLGYAAYRAVASRAWYRWPSLFPREEGSRAGETALVAALATLATCASSAGPRLLLMTARAGEDFGGITEWERPSLDFFLTLEPIVTVVALAAVAAITFGRDPRTGSRALPAFDLALLAGAILFGARAVRMAPIATLVVAYAAGRRDVSARIDAARLRVAAMVLAVAPAVSVAVRTESRGLGFAPRHYPEGAVAWIEGARPAGHMWNFMPFGGWLAYRLYPEYLVLMDGRNALARDVALVSLARDSCWDARAFASIVRDLDIQWAVSDASPSSTMGAPLANDPARWAMVQMDDVSAVYVRRDGPNAALAASGYRVLSHLAPPDAVLAASMARDARAGAIAHDGGLAVAQDPGSARAAFFDACGGLATRDEVRFRHAVERVRVLAPSAPLADALLAAWVQSATP